MTKPASAPNAEQFQAVAEALRRAMVPAVQRQGSDSEAEYESNPTPLTADLPSCHCPCGTHPEFPGTCSGYAEPGLTVVVNAPTTGPQHVPLCRNCHDIRMGLAPQGDSDVEAVTDTCTCHCQANHPGRTGICEAASDDGTTIDGEPACLECAGAARRGSPDGQVLPGSAGL
ncbi:hypothetical protein ACFQ7F_26655 [Streptomyces sp. NPDC056486]|uniref:hypothetical protein n=1 Tax=Streptomyces sp. NPDC056486 TaxID=3345835 RepID=UPI00368E362A